MKYLKSCILSVCLFLSGAASANLISNGSFENENVAEGTWQYYSSSNVDGWEGSNIEIWDSYTNFEAYDGEQFAELNAHPDTGGSFSIYQTFDTVIGNVYSVEFAYAARKFLNETFEFEILSASGEEIFSDVLNDHEVSEWSLYSTTFVATSTTSTIQFTSVVRQNSTVGNFLDDIVVLEVSSTSATTAVPEPSSIYMMSIALLALVRLGKRKV